MRMHLPRWSAVAVSAGLAFASLPAAADTIDPLTFDGTLAVGESVTIRKTVTVDEGRPTSAKVDVFFLSDTTGSMGGVINAVKANASAILSNLSGLGDVQFGVGEYRDVGDPFVFRTNTALTDNSAAVQAGINQWFASGGGDTPEANLFALESAAEDTDWRDGSTRIAVWFGDAPGHDPRAGSTEASATAALLAENIRVLAVNSSALDATGQATRITDATGGDLFNLVGSGASISDVIDDLINAVFASYTTVALDASAAPAGVGVAISPVSITGDFDRSIERTFEFDVTFTGLAPGTYDFPIHALVDGGTVATETDRIVVTGGGGTPVPEPGTLALLGAGLFGLAGMARRRG
jgi:PEP-CTERM motif